MLELKGILVPSVRKSVSLKADTRKDIRENISTYLSSCPCHYGFPWSIVHVHGVTSFTLVALPVLAVRISSRVCRENTNFHVDIHAMTGPWTARPGCILTSSVVHRGRLQGGGKGRGEARSPPLLICLEHLWKRQKLKSKTCGVCGGGGGS